MQDNDAGIHGDLPDRCKVPGRVKRHLVQCGIDRQLAGRCEQHGVTIASHHANAQGIRGNPQNFKMEGIGCEFYKI